MTTLAVISLTAFLCFCGVQSAQQPDLEQQFLNSGTVVFLDFLEKVRSATEKLIRDDQFKKSRITFQGYVKALREFAVSLKNPDSAGKRQNNVGVPLQFFSVAVVSLRQMATDVSDRFLLPYVNMYRATLKKETIMDIWKEVDKYYFPGAPPIYSKPMEFISYILAKAVVRSQMVKIVKAEVDGLEDFGKIDFSQLHERINEAINLIRKKASEISVLEKQKEKNDFLVSLRTISGIVVFYWENFLEQTENPLFQKEVEDTLMKWKELLEFRNTDEKHHVLLSPETWAQFKREIEYHFGFYLKAALEACIDIGVQTLGSKRFSQSNRAIARSAFVFSRPFCENLSKMGFGFTEINRFLNGVDDITMIFSECIISSESLIPLKTIAGLIYFRGLEIIEEEKKAYDIQHSLPLGRYFPVCLKTLLAVEKAKYADKTETELKQMESVWNDAKRIIINELVKSNAFTRKQLDVLNNNAQDIRWFLEQQGYRADAELIDPTIVAFKRFLHRTNTMLRDFWDLLLE